ncbi:MAG: Holliday junction resolvase RuvX [Acidiferrobacteraceae bacterium]
MSRTYLGFDFGTRRIGVAVGRSPGNRCEALDTVRMAANRPDWEHLTRLISTWKPDALVVGLPVHMDGRDCPATAGARRFGYRLAGRYNLPVHWADERLTSVAARHMLADAGASSRRHKPAVDRVAARLLLEGFLAGQGKSGAP